MCCFKSLLFFCSLFIYSSPVQCILPAPPLSPPTSFFPDMLLLHFPFRKELGCVTSVTHWLRVDSINLAGKVGVSCLPHRFKPYSSDGKVSWQSEAKEFHKVTPHITRQTSQKDLLGEQKGDLPLLWQETEENWTGYRVCIVFLAEGVELFRVKLSRVEMGGI